MCEDCGAHGGSHSHSHDDHDHSHSHDDHDHSHSHGDHSHSHDDHDHSHSHDDHDHSHSHTHAGANDDGHSHDHDTAIETDGTVRIAVTGKGGVGKSTLSAAIAHHLAAHHDVVAVDADPDMNLAGALDVEEPAAITDERDLIEDRAGSGGGLIALTPEVEDVIESHSTPFGDGGRLLTIGAPDAGNTGCLCPENSFVRSLVSSALAADHVVMDMEAGVEHLGRGTAESVDAMVVVVDPSRAAIDTAERVERLADDMGVDEVRAVVNKTRGDPERIRELLDVPVVTTIPFDEDVAEAGLAGESPVAASERLQAAAAEIVGAFRPAAVDPIDAVDAD
ncbi:ArsA-related P-loop ATPase [Halorubrum sp. DTA98]|uniref:ATP-binding protein n=1 Tax=Halorubrum sp. DTA98 TaxID=3402163 RepID=UPI003AAF5FDB